MASVTDEGLCERCREPNGWRFIDPEHKYLCGPCSESKDASYLGNHYRYTKKCSGSNCSTLGVVNYHSKDEDLFYCGASPRCIP